METLSINGVTVDEGAIWRETALFSGASDPDAAARRSLAVRELMLQRAGELGMLEGGLSRERVAFASRADEDAVIDALIEAEVRVPAPEDRECRRYFDAHPEQFTSGELVEARHILFAVTSGTSVPPLRALAERTLAELRSDPARFAERARELSNCPSGAQGGNLGQFGRGQMVPEFDKAVFGSSAIGVLPQLVATRYGFHVVEVVHRTPGRALPFEHVQTWIAERLAATSEARALAQYVKVLAGRARMAGVELDAAATPLVQ
ncbi:MAG TPA: peptidylprolyl isomerase [Casimicrobiaceae bacterium]|nr:peptidylprolyl isomerase [Casimicrobiaceae bacterium]